MNFVDELNSPKQFNPDEKERRQNKYVNEVISFIMSECRSHKEDHILEGEYESCSDYTIISRRKKSEIATKTCRRLIGKLPNDSEKARAEEYQREYLYYNNPQELKAKLSDEIKKLGFTDFEVDFIRRDEYWVQENRTFFGSFKENEISTGRYHYVLYLRLKW